MSNSVENEQTRARDSGDNSRQKSQAVAVQPTAEKKPLIKAVYAIHATHSAKMTDFARAVFDYNSSLRLAYDRPRASLLYILY